MTWVATAVAAGTAIVGTGTEMYANNQKLKKQDNIAAAGIMRQRELQSQANSSVQQSIQKNATDNQQNINKNTANEQAQYAAALQRATPTSNAALSDAPGGSAKYASAVAKARSGVADYGSNLAATTAATDAPLLTQEQTQLGLGDTATKLGLVNDTSNRQATLTGDAVNAVQANPWLIGAGNVIAGAGQGYASAYGYKKGAGTLDAYGRNASDPNYLTVPNAG